MADHPKDENSAPNQADSQPAIKNADLAEGVAGAEVPGEDYPRRTGKRDLSAAGLTSIWETVHRGARDMGVKRSLKTLLNVNQKDGFDCPSCAWPDPDGDRKTAEFCENGAKAVASEATRQAHHAGVLRAAPDRGAAATDATCGSDQQGRLTAPDGAPARRRPLRADLVGRRVRADRARAERARVARTRRRSTRRVGRATRRRSCTACSRASSAPTTCPTARTCATSRAASA